MKSMFGVLVVYVQTVLIFNNIHICKYGICIDFYFPLFFYLYIEIQSLDCPGLGKRTQTNKTYAGMWLAENKRGCKSVG